MSLHKAAPEGGTGFLRPLSDAERLELLESAVVTTYERLGCPLSDEAEDCFASEVDALFRACLFARRAAPPRSFAARTRTQALMFAAARGADT